MSQYYRLVKLSDSYERRATDALYNALGDRGFTTDQAQRVLAPYYSNPHAIFVHLVKSGCIAPTSSPEIIRCPRCNGSGKERHPIYPGGPTQLRKCSQCRGEGYIKVR